MASGMVGTVGKFISATHMGMASKPSFGAPGAKPGAPSASTAMASLPRRSMILVKSYFICSCSFHPPERALKILL